MVRLQSGTLGIMMLRWRNNFDGTTGRFRDLDIIVTAEMQLLLIMGAEMVIV
jgi:hypothetical protein